MIIPRVRQTISWRDLFCGVKDIALRTFGRHRQGLSVPKDGRIVLLQQGISQFD
jgi:hypothetical protein